MEKNKRSSYSFLAEALALFITFTAPLKFGSIVGVPEIPATYLFSLVDILFIVWPINILLLLNAILLALCLITAPRRPEKNRILGLYTFLWVMLAFISLLGIINASTWDFYTQMVAYCFGIACYCISIYLLLSNRRAFASRLIWCVLISSLFSVMSGYYQYFQGFEATNKFIYEQGVQTGVNLAEGNMGTRLGEARVSADFAICNVYGGYLAMILPLLLFGFWNVGEKYFDKPKVARWVLTVPLLFIMLFLIKETGSRGAVLSLIGGIFAILFCMKMSWKWRWISMAALAVLTAGFIVMVVTGRGFASMQFRFDYFQAAGRMMLEHPFAGTGWGDFFHDYTSRKLMSNTEAPHTPHSMIFLFASQTGVPGFLVSFLLLVLPCLCGVLVIRRWKNTDDKNSLFYIIILTMSFAIWVVDALLEVNFETPGSLIPAIAVSYVLLSLPEMDSLDFLARIRVKKELSRPLLVLFCFLFAGFSFMYTLYYMRAEIAHSILYENSNPRYMAISGNQPLPPAKVDQLFRQAKEYAPDSPFPWSAMSEYMFLQRNPVLGEEYLNEAIKRSPERPGFYFRKFGILYRLPERRSEALENLEKARELFPGNPDYSDEKVFDTGTGNKG